MKAKITATLTVLAAIFGVDNAVYAQSTVQPQPGNFTLSGRSLVNIDYRNAEDDFRKFFQQDNPNLISNNQSDENTVSQELPLSESISASTDSIFLQPATQNINGNDGLQVQLDLSDNQ
jgi:hypothetical protein